MGPMFDVEKVEARLKEIAAAPPFRPDVYEARYTVIQAFPGGQMVTLHFVIRDGQPFYYRP